jgi:hypothetical protein
MDISELFPAGPILSELAKHAAELGVTFGEVTVSVVQVALPTVREHEAWKLR